jgi:hypothetical protein
MEVTASCGCVTCEKCGLEGFREKACRSCGVKGDGRLNRYEKEEEKELEKD